MTGWRKLAFALVMVALTFAFIGLGVWQWQRMGEKQALIALVASRLEQPPVPVAEAEQDPDYRPVSLTGAYSAASTVLVFTSLTGARGQYAGPGYWVMTALALDDGGSVFVNRGFIPENRRVEFAEGAVPSGRQQLTGIARAPERPGSFTPAPDRAGRIDWVRDPERLAAHAGDLPQPLLMLTVDLPAGPPGTLPQGGETVVGFPNNHLGYALTWFGFAILTPILLVFWLRRQRRAAAGP